MILDPEHLPPPLPIPLKVADEEDSIEDGTLGVGAQHPGPSGTDSQRLLDILHDKWSYANRELAAGSSVACAAVMIPLVGGGRR